MIFTHVDKPIKLGPVTLKNRVCRAAHLTGMATSGMTDTLIGYHEARAKGGVALTILEILSVHPSSPTFLNAWAPNIADGYAALVDRCRPHGMKLFHQIWHGGHHAAPVDQSPPWSASDTVSPILGQVAQPMTKMMIDDIVAAYARTAELCVRLGLDGVEVHAAHGYLPSQFLSPAMNRREDDYGGSLENRARLTLEVLRAVRSAVPTDFAVGVRVAPDLVVGGADLDQWLDLLKLIEAEDLVHFVDASLGSYQAFDKFFSGMHDGAGYEMSTSAPIARATAYPTVVTGLFRTLEEADTVIRAGDAQLVSMTRAHIADPDLVVKSLSGRTEDVRPCIGCNQGCVGGLRGTARRIGCTVNAQVGEENLSEQRLAPATKPKTVVVVGGGPAGMEAARVAALRGHRVVLMEAECALGGQLKLAKLAPTRAMINDIAVWLEEQVYKLGVDVRCSLYAEVPDVLAEKPDLVIVATGSFPRMDGIQWSNPGEAIIGLERRNLLSGQDLFSDLDQDHGRTAVVIDDVGHYEGIAAVEHLRRKGVAVTYVSRHLSFGALVEGAEMPVPALRRMGGGDLSLKLRSRAVRMDDHSVTVGPTYMAAEGNVLENISADSVVLITANAPNNELALALRDSGVRVIKAGEANTPRFLQMAIREGHLAGAAA